jgi:hypothetical protein
MKFYIFSALVAVSCGFPLTPSGDADNVKAALANMNADQLLKITKKGLSFAQLEEEALPAGLGDSMMALIEAALTSNDEAQQANKASLANNGNLITSTVKSIAEKGEAIGQEKKKQADLVAKKEKWTGEQEELEATLAALVSVESELNEVKGDIADEKSTILALKTYTESLGPWVKCARENGVCSCTTTVRYGENGVFTEKPAPPSGTIGCNNGVFGDPLRGTVKHCHCEDAKRTLPEDLESGTLELVETALKANSEAQETNAKSLADTENSISETRDAIATKVSGIEQCEVDHAASVEKEGNLRGDKVVLEETLKELKDEKENLETVQVRLDAELASINKLKGDILAESGCRVETWGGGLDDAKWQASINENAIAGTTYQVDAFYNGIGNINGVSCLRIIGEGCRVQFKDKSGSPLCTLAPGESCYHNNGCGNDVITQYNVLE